MLVLYIPLAAEGHINTSLGLAYVLQNRGHRVVVATERNYVGRFTKHGFEEGVYDEKRSDEIPSWETVVEKVLTKVRLPPDECIDIHYDFMERNLVGSKMLNEHIQAIIDEKKPDIIIQDVNIMIAAVKKSKIPVVYHCPLNPLRSLAKENLPPYWTGMSLMNPDHEKWKEYRQRRESIMLPLWKKFNEWLVSEGATELEYMRFICTSKDLNLITFPKILVDNFYLKGEPLATNYHCLDHSLRPCKETFEIPEKLRDLPGKLILLSMGTIGNRDVALMKLLLEVLGNTKHRYIVSTGHYYDRLELTDNMWGAPSLPQLAVLQVVDLFITHGGNNSFVESLYYGVPMVVTPLIVDQFENATLAEEAKLGAKFLPFQESKENLPTKVEMVLKSEEIRTNVQKVSQSMRESNSLNEAVTKMEQLVKSRNQNDLN